MFHCVPGTSASLESLHDAFAPAACAGSDTISHFRGDIPQFHPASWPFGSLCCSRIVRNMMIVRRGIVPGSGHADVSVMAATVDIVRVFLPIMSESKFDHCGNDLSVLPARGTISYLPSLSRKQPHLPGHVSKVLPRSACKGLTTAVTTCPSFRHVGSFPIYRLPAGNGLTCMLGS
ncbi:hypothetical protein Bbelb_007640 [Branchiostoma belcheri]|nr:hypothetical protein Bbelb_007640 [Branchiostoma belcheri]